MYMALHVHNVVQVDGPYADVHSELFSMFFILFAANNLHDNNTTTQPMTRSTPLTSPAQRTTPVHEVMTHSKGSAEHQKDELEPCPELEDEGIYWLSTEPGEVAVKECPYEMIGWFHL